MDFRPRWLSGQEKYRLPLQSAALDFLTQFLTVELVSVYFPLRSIAIHLHWMLCKCLFLFGFACGVQPAAHKDVIENPCVGGSIPSQATK